MSKLPSPLNPDAAEFVPRFQTNDSRHENSGNAHPCGPLQKSRSVRKPAIPTPVISPYLSALKADCTAKANFVPQNSSLAQSVGVVAPENTWSYDDLLSQWQRRRISKPNPSVMSKWKDKWMGIARESSKLTSLSPDTAKIGANAGSVDALPAGPGVAWHSILGQPQPVLSTAALLDSEIFCKAALAVKLPAEGVHMGSSYVKWWTAVLAADVTTLHELLSRKYPWDCAFTAVEFCADTVTNKHVHGIEHLSGSLLTIALPHTDKRAIDIDITGLNALHVCSMLPTHALILEQLLQYDAVSLNIDYRERKQKRTAVHYTALADNLEALRILMSYGVDIAAKDKSGDTMLHIASRQNNAAMVAYVCDKARLVNVGNKASETPLLLARSREVAHLLIAAGADVSHKNAQGVDAATLAAQMGNTSLLQVLLTANTAHRNSNQSSADLSKGIKCNAYSTPLHAACTHGPLSCVKLLLSLCAYKPPYTQCIHSCDMCTIDRPTYRTPLMCAALQGHADIFALLILHGANPRIESIGNNLTALALAVAQPTVSEEFVHTVFRTLITQCDRGDTSMLVALVQDNCAGQSLLMCVLQQVVRAAKVDIRQRDNVVSVMQPYWPKIAALLLYGAPLRCDFLTCVALPQCMRYIAQSGLDIDSPLHIWRTHLSKPILWEHEVAEFTFSTSPVACYVPAGSTTSSTIDANTVATSSVHNLCAIAADSTGQTRAVQHLYQFAARLDAHCTSFGDHTGQPDVCILVNAVNTGTRSDVKAKELYAHSFVLRTERAGVLCNMLQSEMATTECVHTTDGPHVYTVLSFPHISAGMYELLLWWIYTGRDVCYQQSMQTVMELLYVANELLVEGLQELCEAHLCLRLRETNTTTDPAAIAQLTESIHCPLLQTVCAQQHSDTDGDIGSVLSHLATRSAEYSSQSLHGVFLKYVYSESTLGSSVTAAVATLQTALSMVLNEYAQHKMHVPACIARVAEYVSANLHTCYEDSRLLDAAVEALLFALQCWQQRLTLRLQLRECSTCCDVVLQLHSTHDDQGVDSGAAVLRIAAHRAILAYSSLKLRGMIHFTLAQQGSSTEQGTSNIHGHSSQLMLHMQGISEQALRALVQYMYTATLPTATTTDMLLFELLAVADEHIMPSLTEYVSQLLVATLSCENSMQTFCAAVHYQLPLLRTFSTLFVIKQYGGADLSGSDEYESSCELVAEALFSLVFEPA